MLLWLIKSGTPLEFWIRLPLPNNVFAFPENHFLLFYLEENLVGYGNKLLKQTAVYVHFLIPSIANILHDVFSCILVKSSIFCVNNKSKKVKSYYTCFLVYFFEFSNSFLLENKNSKLKTRISFCVISHYTSIEVDRYNVFIKNVEPSY